MRCALDSMSSAWPQLEGGLSKLYRPGSDALRFAEGRTARTGTSYGAANALRLALRRGTHGERNTYAFHRMPDAAGRSRVEAVETAPYHATGPSRSMQRDGQQAVEHHPAARRPLPRRSKRHASVAQQMSRLLAVIPDSLHSERDTAILLLGFADAFRRSELLSLNNSQGENHHAQHQGAASHAHFGWRLVVVGVNAALYTLPPSSCASAFSSQLSQG